MAKTLYYGIGGLLLLGVVVALFVLYKGIENSQSITLYEAPSLQPQEKQKRDFGWLKTLGETQPLSFSYPVDELHIKISLSDLLQPKKIVQVIADTVDSYQYFCIIQILNQMKVHYSILKQEKDFVANIADIDDLTVQELKNNLNYYQINYELNIFYTKDY